MKRLTALIGLLLVLASCNGGGDTNSAGGQIDASSPIQWDRSASAVIFRAEIVGGNAADDFYRRNEVPPCTIYGDNRVVWTVDTTGISTQVLHDRLTDSQIANFVSILTVTDRIFTYDAQADEQIPSDPAPVVETITLFVNGVQHKTDAFSNWPSDFYATVLERCRSLSPSPVEFAPEAAWISAKEVTFDPSVPNIIWDSRAAQLSLKELADSGERRWVSGPNAAILWRLLRKTALDAQFSEGSGNYQVAVEAPNVNPSAPPAPSGS